VNRTIIEDESRFAMSLLTFPTGLLFKAKN